VLARPEMDLRKTVNHEGQILTAVPSVRLPEVFLGSEALAKAMDITPDLSAPSD
jgi:hypothetical protein